MQHYYAWTTKYLDLNHLCHGNVSKSGFNSGRLAIIIGFTMKQQTIIIASPNVRLSSYCTYSDIMKGLEAKKVAGVSRPSRS
jgi:hypothetical protein